MNYAPFPAWHLNRRTFLFLQGPSSRLFARIADHLEARGHRCLRINLSAGDWVFWHDKRASNFRGGIDEWPNYVAGLLDHEAISDLVLLGEERPHHRIAVTAAKTRGVDVFTVEMGYLRPDWVALEYGGSGCNSHFPTDPRHIVHAAAALPEPDFEHRFSHSFLAEAAADLMFNLPNIVAGPFLFPHYRWHALFHPLAEYGGWLKRLASASRRARNASATMEMLRRRRPPFFLFPLQLETDYQIRSHSPFVSQHDAIEEVIRSFAARAPVDAEMLFKLHPLDNGLIDWRRSIMASAVFHGVAPRVHFIDGGNLDALLCAAKGVVMINSTVGLQAIRKGIPTKALGVAIYDIVGLSHQGSIDDFWKEPPQPDDRLRDSFLRLIAAALHVRGNFYSRSGIEAAAGAIAARLHAQTVNKPAALAATPLRRRPAKVKRPASVPAIPVTAAQEFPHLASFDV
ncbi:MAG TPA: capsular biosynthesis protein [Pararhizobium sp.]|nr:capsular biosynthesis protein [Pararhizobium sp.]